MAEEDVWETGETLVGSFDRDEFEACLSQHNLRPKVVGVAMSDYYSLREQYPNGNPGTTHDQWGLLSGHILPYFWAESTMVVGVCTSHPSMLFLLEPG